MRTELKPCPFCGEEPSFISRPIVLGGNVRAYHIECRCGVCTTEATDEKSVLDHWNNRIYDDEIIEDIGSLDDEEEAADGDWDDDEDDFMGADEDE